MNKFAERLKELLSVKELTQYKLAKQLGTSHQTVSRWCCGEREPNFDMLLLICEKLEEDPNYLLGWED